MPSPFPGMDPFLEACGLWEDFHPKLIGEIERTLAMMVPDRYFVRIGVRSYFVSQDFVATEYRETFIDIYVHDPEKRLVTGIEVLSPSNKRRGSEGWEQYVRKRQGFLLGAANLVELDLLRGGQRMPMITPWPTSPYALLVSRRERAPRCKVWPAFLHRPLPPIQVPLSPPDADVRLDLQPLIAAIYARARYEGDIDYSRSLQPALTEEETAWLAQQRGGSS